jgi:hypothetical protein
MLRARPGETRIDPSFLKKKGIINQGQLDRAEAENVRKATIKYLAGALRVSEMDSPSKHRTLGVDSPRVGCREHGEQEQDW